MHELSIVMSIIETAEEQVKKHNATSVESIDLIIGNLSGVDYHALEFAWEAAAKNTVLESAIRNIARVTGRARCSQCDCEFELKEVYEGCPQCGQHLLHILQGKELQIQSMILN
jgi:hydrogenase nickel incorporation protein HypA/HybF